MDNLNNLSFKDILKLALLWIVLSFLVYEIYPFLKKLIIGLVS